MVETITIDGRLVPLEELEAILGPLDEPLTPAELQALIDEANRDASSELAGLLAALTVVSIAAAVQVPRQRITYSIRDRAFYRGRSPLTTAEISRRLNAEQQRNAMRFRRRTEDMIAGRLSFEQWQRQTAQDILLSHTRAFEAGAGTASSLTAEHINALRELTRDELRFFHGFAQQILRGELSEAMMLYRSSRYGGAMIKAYSTADHVSHLDGTWEARRSLKSPPHCKECPNYDTNGQWLPVDQVVPKGRACSCGGFCKCVLTYRQVNLSDRLPG